MKLVSHNRADLKFDRIFAKHVPSLLMKDKDRTEPEDLKDVLRDEKQRGASRYSVS